MGEWKNEEWEVFEWGRLHLDGWAVGVGVESQGVPTLVAWSRRSVKLTILILIQPSTTTLPRPSVSSMSLEEKRSRAYLPTAVESWR